MVWISSELFWTFDNKINLMKKNIYYLNGLIILLVIFSCSSRPPLWIGERPSNSEYWHGIGYAENSTETNSKTLAKEYAIHEISSQIKVNISSELDIVVTDFNGSVDNAISSVMRSRVDLLLPELEFIGSYDDNSGTFFYARLNKEKYRVAMERLRENAKKSVISYIREADKNFGARSFVLVQKAWQEIIPFNDEPLEAIYNGKDYHLYSLIKGKLEEFDQKIDLQGTLDRTTVRTFVDRENSVSVTAKNRTSGEEIIGLPIKIMYLDQEITGVTDNNGVIICDLPKVSLNKSFSVNFQLDDKRLFGELSNTTNILSFSSKTNSVKVNVVPSRAKIESSETNLNRTLSSPILEPAIKEAFSNSLEFVQSNPDLIITIKSSADKKSKRMGSNFPYFTFGNASVTFKDAETNEEFFSSHISNVKGADFDSQETAGIRSYEKMSKTILTELEQQLATFKE